MLLGLLCVLLICFVCGLAFAVSFAFPCIAIACLLLLLWSVFKNPRKAKNKLKTQSLHISELDSHLTVFLVKKIACVLKQSIRIANGKIQHSMEIFRRNFSVCLTYQIVDLQVCLISLPISGRKSLDKDLPS